MKQMPGQGNSHLQALMPLAERIATYRFANKATFPLCVRGAFSKCFEFVQQAYSRKEEYIPYFFIVPSLRGICEDLIVLGFIRHMPTTDRNELLQLLLEHELMDRVAQQKTFFESAHPSQSVINIPFPRTIEMVEGKIRSIWQRHGWPNLTKGVMPQTRQLAERIRLDVLGPLYDYLFRLTSGTVHFNPQAIFRTGWTNKPPFFKFSTRHFDVYHRELSRVYGTYMLCTYFELFGSILRPTATESTHVQGLREALLMEPRWPEMVTWEEMNIKPPYQGILHLLARVARTREAGGRLHKRKKSK
ncbi:DUF5677 domain-containing protein [Sorangium sp. So ce119]|uniref:DUF5677 domain-containing protein n=1 Tax=Sorangium sp. So ce119 TaxID=3133279 RepID=UPI003F615D2B